MSNLPLSLPRRAGRLLVLLAVLTFSSCQQKPQFYPYERLLLLGDDPTWATPDLDTEQWSKVGWVDTMAVFWVRFRINLPAQYLDQIKHKGIEVISIGSYDAYWDGNYIGSSGVVGDRKENEVPGNFLSRQLLPDSLATPGEHVLALRVSRFHSREFPTWHNFHLGEYFELGRLGMQVSAVMFILGGLFLLVGLYFLLLFFTQTSDFTRLIFGIMCLLFFTQLVLEYYKFLVPYPYTFHYTRLIYIGLLSLALTILTPWFFAVYFAIPYRKWFLPIYAVLTCSVLFFWPVSFDTTVMLLGKITWISAGLLVAYAWWMGKKEAHIVLAALLLCAVFPSLIAGVTFMRFIWLHSFDVSLFLSFALLVLTQVFLMVKRAQSQRLAYENSLLQSARLQNELLRKNIQPHYLLNTLTSLIDWVEEAPRESVAFIEALAEEFNAFHAIAEEKRIALPKALHLCKSHLKVMKFRKEVEYEWTETGLDYAEMLPPGVLLTLVENGITHNKPGPDRKIRFQLIYERKNEERSYQLLVFGQPRKSIHRLSSGTGMRYVQSRLEESYGQQWDLHSTQIPNGWKTTFTFTP